MWGMKGKRERQAKSELRKASSTVKFLSKDKAFSSRSVEPIKKHLIGHAANFGSYYAMKKQGHFDRYHGVTPIADTQLLPFPVSKAYRLWQRGTADKDPLFRQKD